MLAGVFVFFFGFLFKFAVFLTKDDIRYRGTEKKKEEEIEEKLLSALFFL